MQVMFKMDVDKTKRESGDGDEGEETLRLGGEKILLTCVGAGFKNLSKVTL